MNIEDEIISTWHNEIENTHIYSLVTNKKSVAVITDTNKHLINIAIIYTDCKNKVYQWLIEEDPNFTFESDSNIFLIKIIDYAESMISEATITICEDYEYDKPIEIIQTYSSAGAD